MSTGELNGIPSGELLRSAVERYKNKTGEWPTSSSGDATAYFGFRITWANIDKMMRSADDELSLKSFCHILEFAENQNDELRVELTKAEIAFTSHCIHKTVSSKRPSVADAVFVRISEVLGGTWAVDIYTPDGWGTLFKADSDNEARDIMEVLSRQHRLMERSPVRLPKAEPTPTT